MKFIRCLVIAFAMILSVTAIGDAIGSNGGLAVRAQETVGVKRKKGIIRRGYAGGKWVVKKTWNGSKWVTRKVWVGSKWVGKKSWKTGRKVVSRGKKIIY